MAIVLFNAGAVSVVASIGCVALTGFGPVGFRRSVGVLAELALKTGGALIVGGTLVS
ncbi:MAG: hypothetical protein V1907_03735 [Candidatus Kerfeldbacteria bacterium]